MQKKTDTEEASQPSDLSDSQRWVYPLLGFTGTQILNPPELGDVWAHLLVVTMAGIQLVLV